MEFTVGCCNKDLMDLMAQELPREAAESAERTNLPDYLSCSFPVPQHIEGDELPSNHIFLLVKVLQL